jgi:undecaprenyl pyrophosphate synthase
VLQSTCDQPLRRALIMLDLILRSGAEQRLSDLLRHDRSYADLLAGTVAWSESDAAMLRAALGAPRTAEAGS